MSGRGIDYKQEKIGDFLADEAIRNSDIALDKLRGGDIRGAKDALEEARSNLSELKDKYIEYYEDYPLIDQN